MIQLVNDLYRHMEWADAAVWAAVLNCDPARNDSKLRETLYHIHMTQRAFLRTWLKEPRQPFPTFDELPTLLDWGRTFYSEAFSYLSTLNEDNLAEPLPVPWATMFERVMGRGAEVTTSGETLLQAAFHSLYHRGQANARLRELGGEPPLVDYIAWIWMGKPSADWPGITS